MAREAAAVSSETSCGISFDKLKKWRAEFFEDREAGDRALRKPFEEQKNQRDFIEYFLRPEGSSIPIPHLEAAKAFLFDRQMGAILPLSKYRACVSSSRDRMGNSLIVNPDLTSSELSSLLQRLVSRSQRNLLHTC